MLGSLLLVFSSCFFMMVDNSIGVSITIILHSLSVMVLLMVLKVSWWCGYTVFMLYISGMMILFVYVTSVHFFMYLYRSWFTMSVIFVLVSFFFFCYSCFDKAGLYNDQMGYIMVSIVNSLNMMNVVFFFCFLFLVMILSAKICKMGSKPMKVFNQAC